jgi:hypothetical protein
MRTFHDGLQVIDQAIHNFESLSNSILRLLEGESIEPLKDLLDFFFSQ